MSTSASSSVPRFIAKSGVDEMSLAELPIFYIGLNSPSSRTSVTYEAVLSENENPYKRRCVTIKSGEHGLPVERDGDVLLALFLIAYQSQQSLDTPRAQFSRGNCSSCWVGQIKGSPIAALNSRWIGGFKRTSSSITGSIPTQGNAVKKLSISSRATNSMTGDRASTKSRCRSPMWSSQRTFGPSSKDVGFEISISKSIALSPARLPSKRFAFSANVSTKPSRSTWTW